MNPATTSSSSSAQGYVDDPRNDDVLVYVDGEFVPRNRAVVSVFDSGFVLGDGIWEGLRLVNGTLVALDQHMDRLYEGAIAIALDVGITRDALVAAIPRSMERAFGGMWPATISANRRALAGGRGRPAAERIAGNP